MQSPEIQEQPRLDMATPLASKRRPRGCSHVSADYFNPGGANDLKTTLSRMSAVRHRSSDETLAQKPETPFDFEKTLRSVFQQKDEANIKSRELGVLFKDLRVVGLGATASYQPTFGSMFNPKVIMENIKNSRHPQVRDLLQGFEGTVRPGEMLRAWGSICHLYSIS